MSHTYAPTARKDETRIATGEVSIERKKFLFDLKKNDRGSLLRITEDVQGRRDTIIIPAPGLDDIAAELGRLAALAKLQDGNPAQGFATGQEAEIAKGEVPVERKKFFFSLKKNDKGVLLRITEDVRGRRDHIIIPGPGLDDFTAEVNRLNLVAKAH